jgi:hypothetical protein
VTACAQLTQLDNRVKNRPGLVDDLPTSVNARRIKIGHKHSQFRYRLNHTHIKIDPLADLM